MQRPRMRITSGLMFVLAGSTVYSSPARAEEVFKLSRAVPADVFLFVASRHNPQRRFIEDYWNTVCEALQQSGVGTDVMQLVSSYLSGSYLSGDQQAQVDRLQEKIKTLLAGVKWDELSGREFAFTQRMATPKLDGHNINMGPPEMAWIFRGSEEGAAENFQGLLAIFHALSEEINTATGEDTLSVVESSQGQSKSATLHINHVPQGVPDFDVTVANRKDVILIARGKDLLSDVLGLLAGGSDHKALATQERFQSAVGKLASAEDGLTFFDMRKMLTPIRSLVDQAMAAEADDRITNSMFTPEAKELNDKALEAYRGKDYAKALKIIEQAHELSPINATILYNLACFHALNDHHEEALKWVELSVKAGFYAPHQMTNDPDLASLRSEPRFQAALTTAKEKATHSGSRIVTRIFDLIGMIDYTASVSYTKGHSTYEDSVTVLVPAAADKPIYKVFGSRKPLTGFDRYLPQESTSFSISGGIDLNQLYTFVQNTIRSVGAEGKQALDKWKELQQQIGLDLQRDVLGWIQGETITISLHDDAGNASVWLLKVSDEETAKQKVASALQFLQKGIQELVAKAQTPMLAMVSVQVSPVTQESLQGFHRIALTMNPTAGLVCGVRDGYLIVGTSEKAVELCLATAAGKHPSVSKNKRIMAEALLPEGAFQHITFEDKQNVGKDLQEMIGAISMVAPMAMMSIPDPQVQQVLNKVIGIVAKLVPAAGKIDFYKSSASYTLFDGQQWLTRSVTNYRDPEKSKQAHAAGR